MVSHELRMPLTSIKGSTAPVLRAGQPFAQAELQQFIRIIDHQADRMSDLIGALLDVGRIETGNAGRVSTYETLLRQVWGGRNGDPRSVRAYVRRLRKKLGDDTAQPVCIFTEPRVGYRMAQPT